jgi:dihydrodipicolinate synthase/N-acetylneuraminate lyase
MAVETELQRLLRRQETMIAAIGALGEVVAITNAEVVKILEWMQKAAGTELRDALSHLAISVEANTAATMDMAKQVAALPPSRARAPADVARAVTTGEV